MVVIREWIRSSTEEDLAKQVLCVSRPGDLHGLTNEVADKVVFRLAALELQEQVGPLRVRRPEL